MQSPIPRELSKTVLPTYVIEPPDMLLIEAIHVVPRHPYYLRTLDVLAIEETAGGIPSEEPISGLYQIEPGGFVSLGWGYGRVMVAGITVEQAEEAIEAHLQAGWPAADVSVSLAEIVGRQGIAGEHMVKQDGTVTLGSYGSVRVVGMTIAQAKSAIEEHLSRFLDDPEISLDVFAYNSKMYYVIFQGANLGDRVYPFPITGNDTVLDALSQPEIRGLTEFSSKRIWVARPTDEPETAQPMPVDWDAIAAYGEAGTNYQLFPGDRVYIREDRLVAFDNGLAKLFAPVERVMGFSLLGVGTVTRFSGKVLEGGGNPRGGVGF